MTEGESSHPITIEPTVLTYCQNVLHSIAGWPEFVDSKYECDRHIFLSNLGIPDMQWDVDNQSFNEALKIMGHALKGIYVTYEKRYDFSEPELTFCSMFSYFTIKVGMYKKNKQRVLEIAGLVKLCDPEEDE